MNAVTTGGLGTLLGGLLLAGCATTPPSAFYTLTPIPAAAERHEPLRDDGPALAVGPVDLPEYLDRPQIVSRTDGNRLAIDELHRWGGTLQDDLLRVLGQNLAHLLGTSRVLVYPADARFPLDVRVLASVLELGGRTGGEAVLRVRWVLLDPYAEQTLLTRETSYREPILGEGQAAEVAAMSDAVGGFSRDVAEAIRGLPPRPKPER